MAVGQNQPAVINGAAITAQGINSPLNLSANTVVKAFKGRIVKVNVTTAGSTNGAIYDSATIAGVAAANLVAVIPDVIGTYLIDFPCKNGIVFEPGTGQVVSLSYN